jgi:hypothetical protein
MEKALNIALIITAIHVSMWDSMIFAKIRLYLQRLPEWTHKPLFECLICMGGVYTLVLYPLMYGFDYQIITTMLQVIGINTIIVALIKQMYE